MSSDCKIAFTHDSAQTVVRNARLGLVYWLMNMHDHFDIKSNPPHEDSDAIVQECYTLCHQRFGDAPSSLEGDTPEEQAIYFLKWLQLNGNIVKLCIDDVWI